MNQMAEYKYEEAVKILPEIEERIKSVHKIMEKLTGDEKFSVELNLSITQPREDPGTSLYPNDMVTMMERMMYYPPRRGFRDFGDDMDNGLKLKNMPLSEDFTFRLCEALLQILTEHRARLITTIKKGVQ